MCTEVLAPCSALCPCQMSGPPLGCKRGPWQASKSLSLLSTEGRAQVGKPLSSQYFSRQRGRHSRS